VWTDYGQLLVTVQPASTGGGPGPVELLRADPDGIDSDFILGAERVESAWITSARPGFAMLQFWAAEQMMIVILRTSDYATGALTLTQQMLNYDFVSLDLVDR
jgi:hypothetical protein